MRKIVIFGATSAIAMATARLFAAEGASFALVGRSREKLDACAADLKARGATEVSTHLADLTEIARHEALIATLQRALPDFDTVLVAHGTLTDQKAATESYAVCEREIRANFLSVASLLTPIANWFEGRRMGCIAVISSVAGDRGRQSNYVYGAAKAALSTFVDGLRHRLSRSGVRVITIKPGFVDTPMTAHLQKGPLFVKPEVAGRGIYRAMCGANGIAYIPWFWRGIMAIIRAVPEPIFLKTKL